MKHDFGAVLTCILTCNRCGYKVNGLVAQPPGWTEGCPGHPLVAIKNGGQVKHALYDNPCGEIPLGDHGSCALPPPKCVCDIKNLMAIGHDKGCPEKKR